MKQAKCCLILLAGATGYGMPGPGSPSPPLKSVFTKAALVIQAERVGVCNSSLGQGSITYQVISLYKGPRKIRDLIPVRTGSCKDHAAFLFLRKTSDDAWEESDRFWSVWPAQGLHHDVPGIDPLERLINDAALNLDAEPDAGKIATLHLLEGANTLSDTAERIVTKSTLDPNPVIKLAALGALVRTGKPQYMQMNWRGTCDKLSRRWIQERRKPQRHTLPTPHDQKIGKHLKKWLWSNSPMSG